MADTVLIVDDDEAVLTMLYKVIRSNGIEADTVASGEEALERTAQRTYDLILLGRESNGGWTVFRWYSPPAAGRPDPHHHRQRTQGGL